MTPKEIFETGNTLTLSIARTLIGHTITCTSPEYHANTPHVSTFIIQDIVTEYDYYLTQPCDGYTSRAAYWDSYMTSGQLHEVKTQLRLIDQDGIARFRCHVDECNFYGRNPTFTGSDADREVYYILSE